MLLTYGNEKETLENFVKEMTDTLGSIRNAAKEENRKKCPMPFTTQEARG